MCVCVRALSSSLSACVYKIIYIYVCEWVCVCMFLSTHHTYMHAYMDVCMLHTRLHAYTCTAHTFSTLPAIICLSRRFLLSSPPLRMTALAAQAAHLRIVFRAQTFFTLTRIAGSLADRKKKEGSDGQTHGLNNGGRQVSECGGQVGRAGSGAS